MSQKNSDYPIPALLVTHNQTMTLTRRKRAQDSNAEQLIQLDDAIDALDNKLKPQRRAKPKKDQAANLVTGPSSQSQSSQLSKISLGGSFLKKRDQTQMTKNKDDCGDTGKFAVEQCNWTEKYAPKTLSELVVNPKKIEEFKQLVKNCRLLIITGPTGSAKNTMVHTFARENGIQVVVHKDDPDAFVDDLTPQQQTIGMSGQVYPEDVLKLRDFVAKIKSERG